MRKNWRINGFNYEKDITAKEIGFWEKEKVIDEAAKLGITQNTDLHFEEEPRITIKRIFIPVRWINLGLKKRGDRCCVDSLSALENLVHRSSAEIK